MPRARAGMGTELGAVVSGGAAVLVDEPAEHIHTLDGAYGLRELVGRHRGLQADAAVGTGAVVMVDVGGQHPLEMFDGSR